MIVSAFSGAAREPPTPRAQAVPITGACGSLPHDHVSHRKRPPYAA